MATVTIVNMTCDLTGRKITEDQKAEVITKLNLIGKDGAVIPIEIAIPANSDIDKNALLRAIGNTAEKTPRGSTTTEPEPPQEPEKGKRGKVDGETPAGA